jgi:hypothetical protein
MAGARRTPHVAHAHARAADLPVTEIIAIADTVIVHPDPEIAEVAAPGSR